jgi:RNA recognition motif-containing protein
MTPEAARQVQAICSAPSKFDQNDQASGSSDTSEQFPWAVAGKASRRLKYSDNLGSGDSTPNSKTTDKSLRILVKSLNPASTEQSIGDYFSGFGIVDDVFIRGRDFAFVTFRSYYSNSPLDSTGHVIDGK